MDLSRDLGDGLILRRGTPADADALVQYNTTVLGRSQAHFEAWVRDMTDGRHPVLSASDFTLVEDTRTGKIVSSLNLVRQTWSYAGLKLRVGRPEMVSTHPDYRKRGLVRAQFGVIHEWSRQCRDHLMAITGIPCFYRQFGYEMAIDIGEGRAGLVSQIPALKRGGKEPYRVRPAEEGDLPFMLRVGKQAQQRYLLTSVRNAALLLYELRGRRKKSTARVELRIIETDRGRPIGLLVHSKALSGGRMNACLYELVPGLSWLSVTPSVVRYLKTTGQTYAKRQKAELTQFGFHLGAAHPVYDVIPEKLPITHKPYAWYVRVVDLPAFLRRIQAVLEQRLADSPLPGHTGELKLNFFRDGLRLDFRKGRLANIEPWFPGAEQHEWGDATFPGLTFLQLLFGYRTVDELRHISPDCSARGDGVQALLTALFPKRPSHILPLA